MDNLFLLLGEKLYDRLNNATVGRITEIRLRENRPVYFCDNGVWRFLKDDVGCEVIAKKSDLTRVLDVAGKHSLYTVGDSMLKGFLHFKGGIRLGLGGEGVSDGLKLSGIKNVCSITIRIPLEVKGAADNIIKTINKNRFLNTLIISPPGAGKTTMLREIARLTGDSGKNCVLIDERYELAAVTDGTPVMDVGKCTDIISGIPKITAYQNAVRALSPEVIFTDEVYEKEEINAILDAVRCGASVAATIHSDSVETLKKNGFEELLGVMKVIVILDKTPKIGTIKEVRYA